MINSLDKLKAQFPYLGLGKHSIILTFHLGKLGIPHALVHWPPTVQYGKVGKARNHTNKASICISLLFSMCRAGPTVGSGGHFEISTSRFRGQ